MNYIEQINLLNRVWRKDSLDTIAVAMHVKLLDICNTDAWENPFSLKNDRIMSDLDVSFKTLAAARNKLAQSGLIRFKTKNGSSDCIYEILTADECQQIRTSVKIPKVRDEVRAEVTAEVGDEVTAKVKKPVTGININKTKPKQKTTVAEAKAPPAPDGLYAACMKIYFEWFENQFSIAPKIDALQGKALKDLIKYFTSIIRKNDELVPEDELEERIKTNWKGILDSWGKLEPFLQKQTKLNQISSNIQNIIVQIKKQKDIPGKVTGSKVESQLAAYQNYMNELNEES